MVWCPGAHVCVCGVHVHLTPSKQCAVQLVAAHLFSSAMSTQPADVSAGFTLKGALWPRRIGPGGRVSGLPGGESSSPTGQGGPTATF